MPRSIRTVFVMACAYVAWGGVGCGAEQRARDRQTDPVAAAPPRAGLLNSESYRMQVQLASTLGPGSGSAGSITLQGAVVRPLSAGAP